MYCCRGIHETLRIGRRDALWNEVLIKTLEKGYAVLLPQKGTGSGCEGQGLSKQHQIMVLGRGNCLLVALAVISLGELSESFNSICETVISPLQGVKALR